MNLALFDLDHTLIDFDSGQAWTRFLVERGALPADAEARYLGFCLDYVAGTLDIHAMHRAVVGPLARHDPADLAAWRDAFAAGIAARLPAAMRAIVDRHRARGDLCAVVTATSRVVAEPFARAFGIGHLVATEPARGADGRPSGEIDGLPCFREHKVARVHAWLAGLGDAGHVGGIGRIGARTLADFGESWFYSDSISDLPLLQAVTHPVAVRPDARLRAHAAAAGWRVVE